MEEDWPVNRVEAQDVLSDHMNVCWPELVHTVFKVIFKTKRCVVVKEGVQPNVHDVLRIAWHRHTPSKAGTRDCQVLKTWLDEVFNHLIHTTVWRDEVWVFLVKV